MHRANKDERLLQNYMRYALQSRIILIKSSEYLNIFRYERCRGTERYPYYVTLAAIKDRNLPQY
jgi:hypothetical protein